jgi:hypothetical protein
LIDWAVRRAARKHQAGRGGRSADLAGAEVADRLTKRLRYINPGAPLWRGVEEDLDADALLSADGDGVERWQPADGNTADDHHRHSQNIRTLALSFGEPVGSKPRLSSSLRRWCAGIGAASVCTGVASRAVVSAGLRFRPTSAI